MSGPLASAGWERCPGTSITAPRWPTSSARLRWIKSAPGWATGCSAIRSRNRVYGRACSSNTTTARGVPTPKADTTTRSIPFFPARTTSSAWPTSSAGGILRISGLDRSLDSRADGRWRPASTNFWLANAHDALYPTRGSIIAQSPTGVDGTHVGEELDIQAIYTPTRQTQVGAGYGHVFTGEFLNKATKGVDYSYP